MLLNTVIPSNKRCVLTVFLGEELEFLRDWTPTEFILGLDLSLVHRVGHQTFQDVALVMFETLRADAVNDNIVVGVINVLVGIVL